MVIILLDHVATCHSNDDGAKIADAIRKNLDKEEPIRISFKGVDIVSTSFINSSLISLLDYYSFNYIKSKLSFINTTKHINDLIKNRFLFETQIRKPEPDISHP